MNIINKISKKYKEFFFNRETKKVLREKKVVNIYEAVSIGLLYDASREEDYLRLTKLVKELQQEGKKVDTLGFVKQKEKPYYSFSKLIFGFFSPGDFNWIFQSKSDIVKDFTNKDFDILMDLSPNDIFYTKYIAGLSRAKYKAGKYSDEYYHIYDLLIDIEDSCSMDELIKHYFHYLKTIKNLKTYA